VGGADGAEVDLAVRLAVRLAAWGGLTPCGDIQHPPHFRGNCLRARARCGTLVDAMLPCVRVPDYRGGAGIARKSAYRVVDAVVLRQVAGARALVGAARCTRR
jgi:hypothetical protein